MASGVNTAVENLADALGGEMDPETLLLVAAYIQQKKLGLSRGFCASEGEYIDRWCEMCGRAWGLARKATRMKTTRGLGSWVWKSVV